MISLTWSQTLRCTAGRSRRSSGEAGRDRSEAWPWSSTAGFLRNTAGWAPTRWAGWSAPPRSGRWPRNASSYLRGSGKREGTSPISNHHWKTHPSGCLRDSTKSNEVFYFSLTSWLSFHPQFKGEKKRTKHSTHYVQSDQVWTFWVFLL